MPLVTRNASTTNVFLQADAPADDQKGIWIDSDNGNATINYDGTGFNKSVGVSTARVMAFG